MGGGETFVVSPPPTSHTNPLHIAAITLALSSNLVLAFLCVVHKSHKHIEIRDSGYTDA